MHIRPFACLRYLKSFYPRSFSFTIYFLVILWTIFSPQILLAQSNCSLPIADAWKNHFPFDLIYPIGPAVPAATDCPVINFWGVNRPVCSVKQMTAIIKNLVLARTAVRGLFEL